MLQIIKARWIVLVVWMITAVILFITAPNLEKLTREKGQLKVSERTPTAEALHLWISSQIKMGKKIRVLLYFPNNIYSLRRAGIKKGFICTHDTCSRPPH
ncbi:hypothetical protein ACEQPO_13670 [Bacillus sp. SL00103]